MLQILVCERACVQYAPYVQIKYLCDKREALCSELLLAC